MTRGLLAVLIACAAGMVMVCGALLGPVRAGEAAPPTIPVAEPPPAEVCVTLDMVIEQLGVMFAAMRADGRAVVASDDATGDVLVIVTSPAKPTALQFYLTAGCLTGAEEVPVP